jgi:vacuolar-type H+-ATPase subunit H
MGIGIKAVIDIENKVDEIICQTQKRASQIVEKAKKDSIILKEKMISDVNQKNENKLNNAHKEINKLAEDIIRKGDNNILKVKKAGEKNIDSAAEFIIEKLKEKGN